MSDYAPQPEAVTTPARLTPTEELVLDVLAARYRLGETLWTFSAQCSRPINSLEDKGLVWSKGGIVEKTIRASLTDDGRKLWLSSSYAPIEDPETKRLKVRNKILAALNEVNEPEAAALATMLSYRLVERDA